uniref:Retrotransposon gag domain-containing protein n=1 Tax=Ananas comosus var. bracteatus TaxID=296719 RepID=A0A6V7QM18_ANACO|nr:unnamed protein product [Ananas comosus var. bracteatus]
MVSIHLNDHSGKEKDDYLTGTSAAPETAAPSYKKWMAENNMVMSWLVNSMTPDIGEYFLSVETAKEIWDAVKETFSYAKNTSEVVEIEGILHDLRQGDLTLTQYFNILTHNWRQLDTYEIIARRIKEGFGVIIVGNRGILGIPAGNYMGKLHGKPATWKPARHFEKEGRGNHVNTEEQSKPEASLFNKEQMEMLQKLISNRSSVNTVTNRIIFQSCHWFQNLGPQRHMTGLDTHRAGFRWVPGRDMISHVLDAVPVELREDLSFEEQPVKILAREVKKLRNRDIPYVNVLWSNHGEREATWELESALQERYPHLFQMEP